ncbi:MAG TPA: ribose-phosphate pyrophosphokinase, partial [Blastocatellia bacterium]|nr:ribose-phosphate pyrophosphokinase [Blastocatellia bacterium]
SYVRIKTQLSERQVIVVCTLDRPDEKIIPLLFAAATAKELGATKIGLVAPYLAYMRQDRRFRAGEAITSVHFAHLLSSFIDWLVTVDPHLHRRSSLSEIYSIPSKVVHAAQRVSEWIRENVNDPVLVGPDSESEQWVTAVAEAARAPYVVLKKSRRGDRDVEVSLPKTEQWRERTPVLVDDIISTARTMIETVSYLKRAEMRPAVCIGVHGIFAGNAYHELRTAGAARVVTCNTVPHASNGIDLSDFWPRQLAKWVIEDTSHEP